MEKFFAKILQEVNRQRLYDDVENLWKRELPQTSTAHADTAAYTLELLLRAGIENAEIINFPADGKTVYQDKRMPLAWDASVGKLTIKKSPVLFDDPVVADYQRHPFHLVKGSVGTPLGGQIVRIITEAQMFAGENAEGVLVICSPDTPPRAEILTAALDLGVLGLISDHYVHPCREKAPEAIGWVNACTEGAHWHVQSEDRPFICFSVSTRNGDCLRQAAERGELTALVECDGHRYEGVLPGVTAVVPGRQKKEFWLMAHLYEPLSDDNSTGVAGAIEMVRCIKALIAKGELPELEFSLRLVFSAEMYGFAAFAEHFGGYLGNKTIGAVNLDSLMAGNPGQQLHVYAAAPGTPFFGNALLEMLLDDCLGKDNFLAAKFFENGFYADDTLFGDRTVGLPTVWFIGREKSFWHNSMLTMQTIDCDIFARTCAAIGTWVASLVTLNRQTLPTVLKRAGAYALRHLVEEYRRILQQDIFYADAAWRIKYRLQIDIERLKDFGDVAALPEIEREIALAETIAKQLSEALESYSIPVARFGKWFDNTESVIPSRAGIGFPNDQVNIPLKKRRGLPDGVIYGPFSRILANMDGKKNLQRLIREAEWEEQKTFAESKIKKYLGAIMFLGDYGYLNVAYRQQITQMEIVEALRRGGVKTGDCLFVHSSASAFGRIDGGENTIIDALLEAVGLNGTILMPTFTVPFNSFAGELNKNRRYRPFDENDPSQVWVGSIPQAFLSREGVTRSNHPSHSVAGLGPLAEECLKNHKENDPPTGKHSPFAKLVEFKGKILHFGCGLGSSTYLHFLETKANAPYLQNALCAIKKANGNIRKILIPQHLPGHRDFYSPQAEECKFFRKAMANGLKLKEIVLGLGKIQIIEAMQLYDIGMKLLADEPDVLLCDNPECLFCSKYRCNKREK